MAELRVSAVALRDLRRIATVGRRDHGIAASERHLVGFERLFGLLREQPFAGQELPDIEPGLRSLSHRPHRVLYKVEGGIVIINRIIHQARDLERALRGQR